MQEYLKRNIDLNRATALTIICSLQTITADAVVRFVMVELFCEIPIHRSQVSLPGTAHVKSLSKNLQL